MTGKKRKTAEAEKAESEAESWNQLLHSVPSSSPSPFTSDSLDLAGESLLSSHNRVDEVQYFFNRFVFNSGAERVVTMNGHQCLIPSGCAFLMVCRSHSSALFLKIPAIVWFLILFPVLGPSSAATDRARALSWI